MLSTQFHYFVPFTATITIETTTTEKAFSFFCGWEIRCKWSQIKLFQFFLGTLFLPPTLSCRSSSGCYSLGVGHKGKRTFCLQLSSSVLKVTGIQKTVSNRIKCVLVQVEIMLTVNAEGVIDLDVSRSMVGEG